ncbi:MAG: hypothetical protein COA78_14985 [Blastopirellula sp.]|nr:MAG: hypothetical protein COA78_14985 [Blastopirellula sp.]
MPITSNHDPDFMDTLSIKSHFSVDLDKPALHSSVSQGKSQSEIKEFLNQILTNKELEVMERVVLVQETYAEIGNALGIDRSTAHRIHKQALVKCRTHSAANQVHQQLLIRGECIVNPITSEFYNFHGYSVLKKENSRQFNDLPSAETIHAYLWKNKKSLNFSDDEMQSKSNSRLFIRGSRCGDTHWILQQTYIASEFEQACALAIQEGQKTMYEFENKRTIEVPRLIPPAI